ncbi:MAG TPA: DUF4290 domain-containing protein [Saprospiraceae bacterium]|nr:DUF4290 domain-containing protein [Saprospiraceae bacterium]
MIRSNEGEKTLEYNSGREKLILPEYGRNIQKLVLHVKEIEDPELRQSYVETLVELMNQILPHSKTVKEIEDKLWNHLFFIAGYDIDVKIPEGVIIHEKGDVFMIPSEDMGYPQKKIPYRHYGWNVHTMIQKAITMEEGPKREEFAKIIASYMKLAYRTWGKEQFVNDELIKQDLKKISQGQLVVADDASIDSYKNVTPPGGNSQRRKQYKGSGGGQQNRDGRRFQTNRPSNNNNNNNKRKKRY